MNIQWCASLAIVLAITSGNIQAVPASSDDKPTQHASSESTLSDRGIETQSTATQSHDTVDQAESEEDLTTNETASQSLSSSEEVVSEDELTPLPTFERDPLDNIAGGGGAHSVNEFSGDLVYSYPIFLPPGRNGLTPSVVLSYSSSNKTTRSVLGAAWQLDTPKIERYSRTGIEDLYANHHFTSALAGGNGELIPEDTDENGHGTYLPKVWSQKTKHEFTVDGSWQVITSDGTTYSFGTSADSREQSDDGTRVHTWFVSRIQDTNGNTIEYEYLKSQGAVYLVRILHGSSQAPYETRFEPYFSDGVNQFDSLPSYSKGFPVVEERALLQRIEVLDPVSSDKLVYELTYADQGGLEHNGQRHGQKPFLTQIQQRGVSSSNGTAELPPTTFEYAPYDGSRSYPVEFPQLSTDDFYDNFYFYRTRVPLYLLGDYDGDGWTDVITDVALPEYIDGSWHAVPYERVLLNQGNGQWVEGVKEPTLYDWGLEYRPGNRQIRKYRPPTYMDFEGDFKETLCLRRKTYFNLECQESSFGTQPRADLTFAHLDYNGDSLTDVMLMGKRVTYENQDIRLQGNDGTKFTAISDSNWAILNDIFFDQGTLFGDINGDGTDDLVHSFLYTANGIPEGTLQTERVLLSTYDGWQDVTSTITIPAPLFEIQQNQCTTCPEPGKCGNCSDSPAKATARFLDIDRDGLPDIVRNGFVYLNNGQGWDESPFPIPWTFALPRFEGDNEDILVTFRDLNKDGILERYFENLKGHSGDPLLKVYGNALKDLPVMTSTTSPQGGKAAFEYTPASGYTNPDGSAANRELPVPRLTLSQVSTNDGLGNETTSSYTYAGGKLHRPHVQEQEFLGFGEVTRQFSDGSTLERDFLQGESATNFAMKGLLETERVVGSTGNTLREEQHVYSVETRTAHSFQALEERVVAISFSESDPSIKRAKGASLSYDQYGNVIEEIDYGEVDPGSDFGQFTDIGTDRTTRSIEYIENSDAHILSLPQHEERKDFDGTVIADTRIYYDDLPLGQVAVGNATKQERLLQTPSTFLATSTEYNSVGLPTRFTNAAGHSTNVVYDSHNLFPSQVINAKGQSTQYAYNSLFGTPSVVTDPNGARSVTVRDPLGRLVETSVSDPSSPSQDVIATVNAYETANVPNSVTSTVHTGNEGISVVSAAYSDGFGRIIQLRQEAEGDDIFRVSSTLYDERGNIAKDMLPVLSDGLEFEPIDASELGTSYTYDALDRLTTTSTSVGSTATVYQAWTQSLEDANGHRKDLEYDARGNLVIVTEYLDGASHSTQYSYDALDNLTQIADAHGNIRRLTYDLQGRRLTEEDLHTASDSTFGVWIFSYDENGNLIAETDPKGQTITFTYDELDRVLSEDGNTTSGVDVTWGYDEGLYGIGQLTSVATQAVTKQFAYDILGRVVQQETTLDGTTYMTSFSFNLVGNPLSVTYPDGMLVSYDYDNAGQLTSVARNGQPVVSELQYAPHGLMSRIRYANGVDSIDTYDPAQMYRLTRKETTGSEGSSWQDISYVFDPVGNIQQISDASATATAKTADYTYDDLDRLLAATATGTGNGQDYTRSYSYDILGNILSRSDVGAYSYAGSDSGTSSGTLANPHAVTNVAGTLYSYDANGNLTSNGVWIHSWDYKDRLLSSTDGTAIITYAYDEGGTRVLKENTTTGKRTVYVNQYHDIEDGTTKRHIYAGGLKVATDVVAGHGATNPVCRPPTEGDWLVSESCTFTGGAVAPADVIVEPDTVLTIADEAVLEIDLRNQKLLVRSDGGVLIQEGGTVHQTGGGSLPTGRFHGLVYHHTDHLSSSSVDTDENGNLLEIADYYPFGALRTSEQFASYENDYKFTGKELDGDTGLLYYEARYYDSRIGRFVSIDPWFGDVTDPQSFNKYAYVRNNPLKYVDPSGLKLSDANRQEAFGEMSEHINSEAFRTTLEEGGNSAGVDSLVDKAFELSRKYGTYILPKNYTWEDRLRVYNERMTDGLIIFAESVSSNSYNDGNDQDRDQRVGNLPNGLTGKFDGSYGHTDKLQHFAYSALLAINYGSRPALALGLALEFGQILALKKSGGDRADIVANRLGIMWGRSLLGEHGGQKSVSGFLKERTVNGRPVHEYFSNN